MRKWCALASDASDKSELSEDKASKCETRAMQAEEALAKAQRRCSEQATALTNLQGLLEHMQMQVKRVHTVALVSLRSRTGMRCAQASPCDASIARRRPRRSCLS